MSILFFKQKIAVFVFLSFLASVGIIFSQPMIPSASANDYGLKETMEGNSENELKLDEALIKDEPEVVVGKFIGTLLTWSGVLFLVLVFVGGLTWMTAQGNEQQVDKAKQMIVAAVFGLLIVLSAYAITAYIGGTLTGQ